MNKWLRPAVIILLSITATLILVKFISSFQKPIKPVEDIETVKGVQVKSVSLGNVIAVIPVSGTVSSYNQIELFSEVSGMLLNRNFREGTYFSQGDVVAKIESEELEYNLQAQKSNLLNQVAKMMGDIELDYPSEKATWETFLNSIDVTKPLPPLPKMSNDKIKRYLAGKSILNTYFSIKSQEGRLSKFTIRAPFSGVLSIANVAPNSTVRVGQKLGEFIETGRYELVAELSNNDLQYVKVGSEVNFSDSESKEIKGKVTRINQTLNASQMVSVYIQVYNKTIKNGMFLSGEINGESYDSSIYVNRKLLFDNKIFVVEGDTLTEKPIEVLQLSGEQALIRGLNNNDEIVQGNIKGLFPGMKVRKIENEK